MELLQTNEGGFNMPYLNYIEKITGLQDVILKNVERNDMVTTIFLEMPRKSTPCPSCGQLTDKVHDHRHQKVKDVPAFGSNVILDIRKRRYKCPHCSKNFFEKISFLPKPDYGMRQRCVLQLR